MADQREIDALNEIRALQLRSKKLARIAFILTLIISSLILILFPQLGSRFLMQVLTVFAGASIFGLIFPQKVGLMIARQTYKKQRPHRRLLEFTDAEDIELNVEDALAKIHEKQDKELLKYRRR